ncbi:hypothetical protein CERSUDRAFT_138007, partial [Gelatoporia subvermispora B]
MFDVPRKDMHIKLRELSREYGSDVISLRLTGTRIIALNSMTAILDLLEKRSSIYSDRPRLLMLTDLIGFGWSLPIIPYGKDWRLSRKMFMHLFQPNAVRQWRFIEKEEANELLRRLLHDPDSFCTHLRRMAGAIILRVAYGIKPQERNDPFIQIAERAARVVTIAGEAGGYLVEALPVLKYLPEWMPGTQFKQDAKLFGQWANDLLHVPYNHIKDRLLPRCAVTELLEHFVYDSSDKAYTEYIARGTIATIYLGRYTEIVSVLETFVMAMALHPEVQEKAWRELECAIGAHQLPDFADQHVLPYITAIMKETIRWKPTIPLVLPRLLNVDDVYNGMHIPKGSLILANSWAVLYDESTYPNPSSFDPDRFIKDNQLDPTVPDPSLVAAFSFGRRICPGLDLAEEELWLTMASILATFKIENGTDPAGQTLRPDTAFESGFIVHPRPFKCSIIPRSSQHKALI